LGFDILIDHKLKPWLLEVNHAPSFATDTPLDQSVKHGAIADAISLLGISVANRTKYMSRVREHIAKTSIINRNYKEIKIEKQKLVDQSLLERERIEKNHAGGYSKIYSIEGSEVYSKFQKASYNLFYD
jgi:tubulin polyglutamylase TTLL6/13